MSEPGGKKRKWKYKQQAIQSKKSRQGNESQWSRKLTAGMTGFFITCTDGKERPCVKESYQLLEEYAEKLRIKSMETVKSEEPGDNNSYSPESGLDHEDIADSLAAECSSLRQHKDDKKLSQASTGVKNCVFIRCSEASDIDPVSVVSLLMEDTRASGKSRSRFIQRILPVQLTCRAFSDNIRKSAEELISGKLSNRKNTEFTYSVQFRTRNNNDISRVDILSTIPEIMKALYPLCRVNLDSPEITVHVEVMGGVCCMSIVKDFFKYRKFNIHEVAMSEAKKLEAEPKEGRAKI